MTSSLAFPDERGTYSVLAAEKDDRGVWYWQAERPSEQHDDRVPIGKAADRCGLREGSEKSKAGVATLEKLRDHEDGEARDENPPGKPFDAPKRAIARDCRAPLRSARFSLGSSRLRPLRDLLRARQFRPLLRRRLAS